MVYDRYTNQSINRPINRYRQINWIRPIREISSKELFNIWKIETLEFLPLYFNFSSVKAEVQFALTILFKNEKIMGYFFPKNSIYRYRPIWKKYIGILSDRPIWKMKFIGAYRPIWKKSYRSYPAVVNIPYLFLKRIPEPISENHIITAWQFFEKNNI